MDMDAQGLARNLLGMDAGGIGKPVVGMDDVVIERAGNDSGDNRIVIDFLMEIGGVSTGKLHRTEVIDVHIIEIRIDVVAQAEVEIGVHNVTHLVLHIVVIDIAPGDRHTVHRHDIGGAAVFIAPWFGQTEYRLYITLGVQTLRYTIVGGSQSTIYMRRILPTKH